MKSTKRYADGSQKNQRKRRRAGIVANPRANFHYPRASIKSRERQEFKTFVVRDAMARALALSDLIGRERAVE